MPVQLAVKPKVVVPSAAMVSFQAALVTGTVAPVVLAVPLQSWMSC